jgi:acetyl-CoA C-acetyltransferase
MPKRVDAAFGCEGALDPTDGGVPHEPVATTGGIITTKAIHELHRTGARYALVTMCIGGGQGIAAIFERA